MKRTFEWIGGFALIAFSFYFTDQVSLLVANKSELMGEIKAVSANYKEDAIDAVVDESKNTIVPGKYGREVNDRESYLAMHDFGAFNENYLVYMPIKPNNSLEDNKDKYITRGNEVNREVSLVIDVNSTIENYLEGLGIDYDVIAYQKDDLKSDKPEYINGASSKDDFKSINSKVPANGHICIVGYSEMTSCLKYHYYIIKHEIYLRANNIASVKSDITSGSIILITENARLEHVKILLDEIKYKDLKIVKVSALISEKGV